MIGNARHLANSDAILFPDRQILDEMAAMKEAGPFLKPVNLKQVPFYKKIIKKPMDLSTVRKRLGELQ